jgi:Outer membrane protein beta-barrel domain
MRIVSSFVLGAALLALTPGAASAQDKRIHFNVGGGPTFAGGDLGNVFSTGWGPAFGVTFDVNERIGVQFEYAFRWFNVDEYIDAQLGRFSANHKTHQLDFNLVANITKPGSKARVYAVFGPGAYQRSVEITEYVGSGIVCDPYFYLCGTYPITDVVGSRGGWDFGFNFGAGVGFGIGEGAEFYIESRYHYVKGPEVDPTVQPITSTTGSKSANGYYYPLTFGFRF